MACSSTECVHFATKLSSTVNSLQGIEEKSGVLGSLLAGPMFGPPSRTEYVSTNLIAMILVGYESEIASPLLVAN
jgi:hypothetical protein